MKKTMRALLITLIVAVLTLLLNCNTDEKNGNSEGKENDNGDSNRSPKCNACSFEPFEPQPGETILALATVNDPDGLDDIASVILKLSLDNRYFCHPEIIVLSPRYNNQGERTGVWEGYLEAPTRPSHEAARDCPYFAEVVDSVGHKSYGCECSFWAPCEE